MDKQTTSKGGLADNFLAQMAAMAIAVVVLMTLAVLIAWATEYIW